MKNYKKNIDDQIEFNQGKNLFLDNGMALRFVDETIKAISRIKDINKECEDFLLDYSTDKAIEEFCRINQYFTFNSQAKSDLRDIYRDLFDNIKRKSSSLDNIERNHYQNLMKWLQETNPFSFKMYSKAESEIKPAVCSEYSVGLQIDLLKIDLKAIKEPLLDIGCGKQATLVNYFHKLGVVVNGIDRLSFSEDYLINSDWLEYNYGQDKWGTIISNLGFSNHFKHHNLRDDGNYIEYAKKYMEILKSLKIGGKFHYAPDLPFIESYLDKEHYKITKYDIGNFDFKTSVIERIK